MTALTPFWRMLASVIGGEGFLQGLSGGHTRYYDDLP
jgi:hypothetical protein